MTHIAPLLQITTQRPSIAANARTIWRTCPECQFEVGWSAAQPSVTHCPYCRVEYQQAHKRWPTLFRTFTEVATVSLCLFGACMAVLLIAYVIATH